MRYLTKSRFNVALACPTRLRYLDDSAYPNQDHVDEFLQALAEGGHQVGALAKCLFPEGIEVRSSGHDAQVAETLELLKRGDVTLFEAAIRHGNLFIRIDLLRRQGNTLELYEVKAKGYDSTEGDSQIIGAKGGFLAGMKPYLYDVAFQRHVLGQAFPGMQIRSYLVMPDKSAVCDESSLAQRLPITKPNGRVQVDSDPSLHDGRLARKLLHVLPVDGFLDKLEVESVESGGYAFAFRDAVQEFSERVERNFMAPRPGSHCKSCPFTASADELAAGKKDGLVECWSAQFGRAPDTLRNRRVLELNNFRRTDELIADGKLLLPELEPEDVKLADKKDEISSSRRQWLQCEESRDVVTAPVAEAHALANAFSSFRFPLHFIDFETARPALPFHENRHPYEQLLFQFSHHRVDTDGNVAHVTQHLDDRIAVFPNIDAVRALASALGSDEGSVLHWWDHERTVLGEIRDQLEASAPADVPDRDSLIVFIGSLLGTKAGPGRLFDLGRLVHRTLFFPSTQGRSSLKKVLPALLAGSALLQSKYSQPVYGSHDGVASLNFQNFAWVEFDESGEVRDPYDLLGSRFEDPELDDAPDLEDERGPIANGGAAMVAYGLLQSGSLSPDQRARLRKQLLRYCELDTLAMVMAWEGVRELLARA